jgi:hypothetical protein
MEGHVCLSALFVVQELATRKKYDWKWTDDWVHVWSAVLVALRRK